MSDSFGTLSTLSVNGKDYLFYSLEVLGRKYDLTRLPFCLKILLENLLRHEDGKDTTRSDIEALANWQPKAEPDTEIAFTPSRVVLQDFTGVPAIVDLAAMRDAMSDLGGDPSKINPLLPAELVIDHSVQVDVFGKANAADLNARMEFDRNRERYGFLRWGQTAFDNFKVVPPNTGIVHQVNLEYLARVVFGEERHGELVAYPDTLVGTDSHTTMINGLGVLGWGVGGIEAEAAMLGQPISMLIPQVVGFRLTGKLAEGATATDLVLTVTEMLRNKGVVGKFVEFFGEGLAELPLADRATIANMSPEYGATCGIFPIDRETLRYLELSGREPEHIALVEAYARAQGLFHEKAQPNAEYTDALQLDLASVQPSLAGPRRPQDRIELSNAKKDYQQHHAKFAKDRQNNDAVNRFANEGGGTSVGNPKMQLGEATVKRDSESFMLVDGAVVIAAITSCTNTSNPAVMVGAGLVARNALRRGLTVKPWVKTSLAPGSMVVSNYLQKAELTDDLNGLGFNLVGYGCTTCIGNSGPLPKDVSAAIAEGQLIVCSVLSGNRNFEGRIHPEVHMNYLASPPLVVAYALAGRMDIDLTREPLGEDADGLPVYLRDIWPAPKEIQELIAACIDPAMFRSSYADVFKGDKNWARLEIPGGDTFAWEPDSTYIRNPPYFEGMTLDVPAVKDIQDARCLALLGDSVTTDHISPAGAFAPDSPAGQYLVEHGVSPGDFNSYGSRRGNHEVMMRGTFANIRLRNQLAPGTEGGWTTHFPSGDVISIYEAAMRYRDDGVPLVVLAGSEYGTGSSRDWAAKGSRLLGVRAVIAKSYERIHRSNLIGMGVLPLQFRGDEDAESLGLSGREVFTITGVDGGQADSVEIRAVAQDGSEIRFGVDVRLDTPKEREYYRHGGILHYVLRQLARDSGKAPSRAT